MTDEHEKPTRLSDGEPKRRRSDRLQQYVAIAFMAVTALAGTALLGSEIAFKVVHAFGWHGGLESHACGELWGLWPSILGSAALYLSSAAYAAGSPTKTGQAMLDALVSRVRED